MPLLTWGPQYEIGIKSIDGQHQKLVNYINQLFEAKEEGKGSDEVELILQRLVDYTDSHFKYEEKLFDLHHYTHEKEHRRLHTLLVAEVVEFKNKYEAGNAELTDEVMDFLKNWLKNHILIEDMKYVEQLKAKGVN